MKESAFNKRIEELCRLGVELQYAYLAKFKKNIFVQPEDGEPWELFNPNHDNDDIEDGVYLTLRCGYNGIYQIYNIWNSKTKKWEMNAADGSYTIMYKDIEPYLT